MKLKIGIVLTSVPAYSETFFSNKINGLIENGMEVILFTGSPLGNNRNLPYEVKEIQVYNKGWLVNLLHVIKACLKAIFINPIRSLKMLRYELADGVSILDSFKNVLVCQSILSYRLDWLHFGFGTLAVGKENVAKTLKAKMAVSFRGYDLYITPLKIDGYYNKLFGKQVKYHVLSQEMCIDLEKKGVERNHIKVITPAIDTSFFMPSTKGDKNDKIQLLTVARLHWKKGLEYTLEALFHLKKMGVDFQYDIIGTGEEYERLMFAVHQFNLSDCVNFIGKQSQEQIKHIMEKTDVYIQYSIQEGFCNAVLEAQAMSLLCVVSNAEGLQENVLNNETGWVVPKRNPQMLALKIKEVIDLSETEKSEVRKAARLRVENNFTLQQQQKKFIEFYNSDH